MDELKDLSLQRIRNVSLEFKRFLYHQIDWNERMIGILGARGVGKTTLMLQYIRENLPDPGKVLYVSLDDLYFTTHSLSELAREFLSYGGKYLFLDEVHKYPNWSVELKKLYDFFPELKIVFSASSVLQIYKGQADLSRRVALYHLPVLSFREFLELYAGLRFPAYSLEAVLENHTAIANEIAGKIKPLEYFEKYLRFGAYPFFTEGLGKYYDKLNQAILQVFESDMPEITNITPKQVKKLKKLMYVISTSAPFKPNLKKLSEQTDIDRKLLYEYLDMLERADLIINLRSPVTGVAALRKPEKIYLNNPNLVFLFGEGMHNKGTVRETFFVNQLRTVVRVYYTKQTDFLVDRKYYFEVGGRNKDFKQIQNLENAFLAIDGIETGFDRKIPLWLFGMLY